MLNTTQQKVYDYLAEQLTGHEVISISKDTLSRKLKMSLSSVRRATDMELLENVDKINLKPIYSFYIGNLICYSYDKDACNRLEMDIHLLN